MSKAKSIATICTAIIIPTATAVASSSIIMNLSKEEKVSKSVRSLYNDIITILKEYNSGCYKWYSKNDSEGYYTETEKEFFSDYYRSIRDLESLISDIVIKYTDCFQPIEITFKGMFTICRDLKKSTTTLTEFETILKDISDRLETLMSDPNILYAPCKVVTGIRGCIANA